MFLHRKFFKSVDRKVTRISVLVYRVKETDRSRDNWQNVSEILNVALYTVQRTALKEKRECEIRLVSNIHEYYGSP
jgi:hypothetical protein